MTGPAAQGDRPGTVTLVGGGPGAVDLLTIAGRRALAEADVVVTDRLGPTAVLAELAEDVEVIDVGKEPGHHPVPQHEISTLLVQQARRGRNVVRLKGGDPFLFGRGGEEVLACRQAGIEVVVVPGVCSALAAPALAGVPVTHRGVAGAVHITTGHAGLDPAAQTALVERCATVVILMGISKVAELTAQALAAGADPHLPAAVVERGSTPQQRVVRSSLQDLPQAVADAEVAAPAVIVIGAVAAETLLQPV